MPETLVSVIIPVAGPAPRLAECFNRLQRQSHARRELIVVCGASSATAVPRETQGVRLVRPRGPLSTAGLINRGLQTAKGELKVVLMPCCVPAGEHWLEEIIAAFGSRATGAVVGRCIPRRESGLRAGAWLMQAAGVPRPPRARGKPRACRTLSGMCDAFRADVLSAIPGPYEESLPVPAAAVALSARIRRAGHRILAIPGGTVLCHGPLRDCSMKEALKGALEWGHADAILSKAHKVEWLGSRRHLAALLALLLVPLGLVKLPLAVILAGLLFAWGWFLPVRVPLAGWVWPLAVLNLAFYMGLVLGLPREWTQVVFDPRTWHPAIVRQWLASSCRRCSGTCLPGWAT